jgi:glycosyltransferase involved in cell wall biosynthesis
VADAVQRDLQRLRPRHPHIVRIYKGHDLDWYCETPADLGEMAVPAGSIAIICVANNRPRKGVPTLVDAFGQLPEQIDAHLLLVGKNMDAPELERQIAANPRRDRIHVLGFRTDAPRLTAGSQIAVLPALKREGLPKTVIEAMAYGVPPVVTDTGGNAELVEDGVSGKVVPPGDATALAAALAELAGDASLRRAMGRAARERIGRHFTVEATVEHTLRFYRDILGEER